MNQIVKIVSLVIYLLMLIVIDCQLRVKNFVTRFFPMGVLSGLSSYVVFFTIYVVTNHVDEEYGVDDNNR